VTAGPLLVKAVKDQTSLVQLVIGNHYRAWLLDEFADPKTRSGWQGL